MTATSTNYIEDISFQEQTYRLSELPKLLLPYVSDRETLKEKTSYCFWTANNLDQFIAKKGKLDGVFQCLSNLRGGLEGLIKFIDFVHDPDTIELCEILEEEPEPPTDKEIISSINNIIRDTHIFQGIKREYSEDKIHIFLGEPHSLNSEFNEFCETNNIDTTSMDSVETYAKAHPLKTLRIN